MLYWYDGISDDIEHGNVTLDVCRKNVNNTSQFTCP